MPSASSRVAGVPGFLLEFRLPSGPSRPGLPRPSVPCRATHRPSSGDAEIRGDGHVPGALDEIPKPVVASLLTAPRGRHGVIIRRSFTPLNYSRTLRAVRHRERSAAVTTTRAGRCRMSVETARLGPREACDPLPVRARPVASAVMQAAAQE